MTSERCGDCEAPLTDEQVQNALTFAVGFMSEFEDDSQQSGVVDALRVLRAAVNQGYRLVRPA